MIGSNFYLRDEFTTDIKLVNLYPQISDNLSETRGSSQTVLRTTYPKIFFKNRFWGSSETVLWTTYPDDFNEVLYSIFIFSKYLGFQ